MTMFYYCNWVLRSMFALIWQLLDNWLKRVLTIQFADSIIEPNALERTGDFPTQACLP